MEFTTLDYILISVMVAFAGWGLFRGLAGELAAAAWIATALAVGYFAYAPTAAAVNTFVSAAKATGGGAKLAAVGITVFETLVAALLVRMAVKKSVSFLLPQPWNAIAGALVGLAKGAVLVAVLTATGMVTTGPASEGFFASRSAIVKTLSQLADSYKAGAGVENE